MLINRAPRLLCFITHCKSRHSIIVIVNHDTHRHIWLQGKILKRMSDMNEHWHAADHEGCEITGYLKVNQVPGTFYIEARSDFQDVLPSMQNVSHRVNWLSFGQPMGKYKKKRLNSAPEEYRMTTALHGEDFVTEKLHRFVCLVLCSQLITNRSLLISLSLSASLSLSLFLCLSLAPRTTHNA